uniref:Uncharacterized protein n=1 Tax=Cucumis sativus TaxID=3659 RepID=A0A0A0LBY9_CUCSA
MTTGQCETSKPNTRIVDKRVGVDVDVDVDLKNFPVLLAEFSRQFPGNGVWRDGLRRMEEKNLKDMNEKWVLLHIEGAELKARKTALLKQQLRTTETNEDVN